MQALRICILAAIVTAALAASSSTKTEKSRKTPQLQRRLGLARIELPEPKLKGLAHRLLQVKRGFLSAQVTASDGHLIGLSFKMKHGHKPGYHLNVGQEYSKKGWDGPGYRKKGWGPPDSGDPPYSSFSAGPYSSYGSPNFQSLFGGAHALTLGHASSMYSEGLQSYYKDAASFGYPFSGYQVPSYVATVPKLPVTKLVDSVPTTLTTVSGVYDQATIVSAPVQTPTVAQSYPVTKAIGRHAKVSAVHRVPLSVLPRKVTYVQQHVASAAHGFHPVLVQKVPVAKFAVHVPQSQYVMHTVKPVSSIGVLRTPIYAATGAGELYPIDVDGSTYQEDDAGGAVDVQNGHAEGQGGSAYGNGDTSSLQNGEPQEGQSNGGGGGKYSYGNGGAAASRNGGAFQRGQFSGGNGGSGRNYGRGNGAAGGSDSGEFNGGGGGKYGHGNGAGGGFNNGGFNGGGSGGGNYGRGNGASGSSDSGEFNGGGGEKYGQGNGAGGGFNNGGFNGGGVKDGQENDETGGFGSGGFSGGGRGTYGHGNGAGGGSGSGGFNGGGRGKYGYVNSAGGGFNGGGFNGGGFNDGDGGARYGHGNSAARGYSTGGFQDDQFSGGGNGNYGRGNGAVAGFGNGAVQRGQSSNGGGGGYGGGNGFQQGLGNNGEGSREGYGSRVPGGSGGYENGGGTQGFPPGLGYAGGDNGGVQAHTGYGNAGTGPQSGFSSGGYQVGSGFSGGANGARDANGGFQSPQQHAFPQAVTVFKDVQVLTPVPGGLGENHAYKQAQPVKLVYEGVREGEIEEQVQHYPDIQGPEESIAREQYNRNDQRYASGNGRINKGVPTEEGEPYVGESGGRLISAAQANGGYKGSQRGSSAAGSSRRNKKGQEDYKNGGGWKPVVDARYNAKLNGGSLRAGEFGSRLQQALPMGPILKNAYGGVPANSPSSFNSGSSDGFVNGDLQVKSSHVQYPKYKYRNEGFFGNSNIQGGDRKFSDGSGGDYFSAQFNGNENGAGSRNDRTKQFNGEDNGRLNHFRNGGGIHSRNYGYLGSNENAGPFAHGKFSNGGVRIQQSDVEQSEGNLRSGFSEARFSEASKRGRFQGNGNGRNFVRTPLNGRFRSRTNGGQPTPPKFCTKGGWKPIIGNAKKGKANNAHRFTQQVPESQRNGFSYTNGFQVSVQAQNGGGTTAGRYTAKLNGFRGNDEVYQGQGPTENGGGSGGYFRGAVGQFEDVGTSDIQAENGNGGANAAFGNGRFNGLTSQGSLETSNEPSNGRHRSVDYSNGQITEFGGTEALQMPRQFASGTAKGLAQGSVYYEGEELPGEESFKREEIKKVFFRPTGRDTKKVPKSVILSGRATSLETSSKSAIPKRAMLNTDISISPSQGVTTKEQPSLEQLLAAYRSDGQKHFALDLRSLRGHGYRDVSFSDPVEAPIQKSSPVNEGETEIVKSVSEGLVTKEVKTESSSDIKKDAVPESLEVLTSAEESSEEQQEDSVPPSAIEPVRSTKPDLPAKKLFVSDAGVGASSTLAELPQTKPESSSSEEAGGSKEKDPVSDTPGSSLDKSALHDTHGGFEMYYGQRRRPISYKQDRISSSYLIPVRVPSSLKSKVRMPRRS